MEILQKFISLKYKFVVFLLLALPAILGAIYIKIFGVNVVYWDQWELVPLIEKLYSGNLTFDQLFAQHNEHRIFFPRIIMLILAHITRYNTIAEMYLSWIITLLTLVLIFVMYKQNFGISESLLLKFIPISWLIFNFRQFENILWGWQIQIYLCVFGFVFSIYMLEKSEKIDCKFLLAIFGGILSSFSFVNGLLVWPTGFLFIILSKTKNKKYLGTAWALVGIAVLCTYLYKWVKPSHHPSILYIIEQPINSIEYLIVNIGSPLGFEHSTAFGMGIFLLFGIIIVSVLLLKNGLLKENAKWLSFIFFSLASSLITTVGRAGFGIEQALSSRYVSFTLLGVVGLYLVIVSLYNKEAVQQFKIGRKRKTYSALNLKRRKIFGLKNNCETASKAKNKNQKYAVLYGMILSIIFVGIILGYVGGLIAGEEISRNRENMAGYLIGYNRTSDETLQNLYPDSDIVKKNAKVLEGRRLNVFSFKDEVYMFYDCLLSNWYNLEHWHNIPTRWTSNNATIFICSSENKNSNLSFNISSFYKPIILQIYLNDELIHEQNIPTSFVNVEIPVKLKGEENIIRFYTPNGCQRPCDIPELKNKDSRCLSLAFQNITITNGSCTDKILTK